MDNIIIDKVRVSGFRGLNNIELPFGRTTVLTGMNNTGKTSILKAIQLVLGSRSFLTIDDFHISEKNKRVSKIVVDIRFIQLDNENKVSETFNENWESIFKEDKIKVDEEFAYVPLRTIIKYNSINSKFEVEQQILNTWNPKEGEIWLDNIGKKQSFLFNEIPFFYIDAQRDIVEDIKLRGSYLGRLLSDIKYEDDDINSLEDLISKVNEQAMDKSDVLKIIQTSLQGLNSAMSTDGGVEITPFAKKIRDLNKHLSIHYGENENSFTMDFHGMGTRSWSSLLTLRAFISYSKSLADKEESPFFPIIAIEEPESHLHPNAQKKLYSQMTSICGQKIISTHSPYIAAATDLSEIRVLYKKGNNINCGKLDFDLLKKDEKRKLTQKVINLRGEIFFSKALVFFEGETEEQALPLFANKYWGSPPHELGIDFIGVGGAGAYLPFIRFADAFNIPWYIFSDGEDRPLKSLKKAICELKKEKDVDLSKEKNIIILEDGLDFEGYLLEKKYEKEIKDALISLHSDDYISKWLEKDGTSKGQIKSDEICDKCTQYIYKAGIRDYKELKGYKNALYDMMVAQKTQFGPAIAEEIIKSGKRIPIKILKLFHQINKDISL